MNDQYEHANQLTSLYNMLWSHSVMNRHKLNLKSMITESFIKDVEYRKKLPIICIWVKNMLNNYHIMGKRKESSEKNLVLKKVQKCLNIIVWQHCNIKVIQVFKT